MEEWEDDLEWQVGRVVGGATGRGLSVDEVVAEIGCGVNGYRRELTRCVVGPAGSVLVVECRDWLTWFGFEHLAAALAVGGRRVVVVDEVETSDGLVREVAEVLTGLWVRLCGRRSVSGWAVKGVAVAVGGGRP